jgi:adenosine kinase
MGYAAQLSLRALDGPCPDLVVISPNDPVAMDQYVRECQELSLPYLYDPSQQLVRMNADEARRGISAARALFVNDYEFALIQKLTGLSASEITGTMQFVVVTRGEEGANVYANGDETHIPVVPPAAIADPTGVGDAFRGGFLAGYARGLDLVTCAQMGALAATYCLEVRGPQAHHYTPGEFLTRFRQHFDDAGKLDILLTA